MLPLDNPRLQLLQIVHQTEKSPLRVDLVSASERESSQPVIVQVAEDRFDHRHAAAVDRSPIRMIDVFSHRRRVRMGVLNLGEKSDLAIRRGLGLSQALLSERAGTALFWPAFKDRSGIAFDHGASRAAFQRLPSRADAGVGQGIVMEIVWDKQPSFRFWFRWLVTLGIGKARITRAHADIGHQSGDARLLQGFQRRFAVIAGIGRYHSLVQGIIAADRRKVFPGAVQYRWK